MPPSEASETTLQTILSGQVMSSLSFGSLALLIWEVLITFDDEVEYIWKKSWTSPIKWFFLFSRYFSVLAQLSTKLLKELGSWGVFDKSTCIIWIVWEAIVAQIMLSVTQIIIMLRVYALYNRKKVIGALFVCLMSVEIFTTTLVFLSTLSRAKFFGNCSIVNPAQYPPYTATIIPFVTDATMFGLAWFKRSNIAQEPRHVRATAALINRDGTWTFATISSILLVHATTSLSLHNVYSSVMFGWFLTISASVGCRLIFNMLHIAQHDNNLPEVLTRDMSMGIISRNSDN